MRLLDMEIDAVLLDVDGTLFSSEGIIFQVYEDEFREFHRKYGVPKKIPTLQEIMAQIGKPVIEIFQNLAPGLAERERDSLSENILNNLVRRIGAGEGDHYSGVFETVQKLSESGFEIYAASNGRFPYVNAILKKNGTLPFFKEVPAIDNVTIKNKNELVSYILQKYKISPERAVLIGDRNSDREAALVNGCKFIACSYGHGDKIEHEGAIFFLDSFPDLLRYVS